MTPRQRASRLIFRLVSLRSHLLRMAGQALIKSHMTWTASLWVAAQVVRRIGDHVAQFVQMLVRKVDMRGTRLGTQLRTRSARWRPPTVAPQGDPATANAPTVNAPVVSPLYTHHPHPHQPQNANRLHAEERAAKVAQGGVMGFNERIAIHLSDAVSTMWCAYAFAVLAIVAIFAVLGYFGALSPLVAAIGAAVSQTFIQLVFLPVLALVGRVQGRHTELQADEQFKVTQRTLHESAQMAHHLSAQDEELLKQTALLLTLVRALVPTSADTSVDTAADTSAAMKTVTATSRPLRSPRSRRSTGAPTP